MNARSIPLIVLLLTFLGCAAASTDKSGPGGDLVHAGLGSSYVFQFRWYRPDGTIDSTITRSDSVVSVIAVDTTIDALEGVSIFERSPRRSDAEMHSTTYLALVSVSEVYFCESDIAQGWILLPSIIHPKQTLMERDTTLEQDSIRYGLSQSLTATYKGSATETIDGESVSVEMAEFVNQSDTRTDTDTLSTTSTWLFHFAPSLGYFTRIEHQTITTDTLRPHETHWASEMVRMRIK